MFITNSHFPSGPSDGESPERELGHTNPSHDLSHMRSHCYAYRHGSGMENTSAGHRATTSSGVGIDREFIQHHKVDEFFAFFYR